MPTITNDMFQMPKKNLLPEDRIEHIPNPLHLTPEAKFHKQRQARQTVSTSEILSDEDSARKAVLSQYPAEVATQSIDFKPYEQWMMHLNRCIEDLRVRAMQ